MQTVKQDGQGAKLPAHETFRVAAVLALVGGFLDIYTYLLRGGVFANAQTGNIVLLAANLAEMDWSRAGYYLIPILAFSAGVFVTNLLKRCFSGTGGIRFAQVVLLIEAALLPTAGYESICDEMWYIYAEEPVRRRRMKESRGYTDEKITQMIASQPTERMFRESCGHMIDNSGTLENTKKQIGELL